MANIDLYSVYNAKRRKFGVNDSDRFRSSFVEAVNTAFAEFNSEVFQDETLSFIDSFDDIIDSRADFTSLTFDSNSNAVCSDRDYWAVEYRLERKSSTNGLTDTIADGSNVTISIADGVLSLNGSAVGLTADLPDVDKMTILISSSSSGIRILVNSDEIDTDSSSETITLDTIPDLSWVPNLEIVPAYTTSDGTDPQPIGTITSRVINGISGFTVVGTAFYSARSKVLDFEINEGTGTTVTDLINSYTATLVSPTWHTAYVTNSCALDSQYSSPFSMAVEYHLQEGGEWAIEPIDDRERKWYGRGVRQARATYQNNTTYTNPLGV